MKRVLIVIAAVLAISQSSFASVNFSKFNSVNGRTGVGTNPYQVGEFKCKISIEPSENALVITQYGAYSSKMSIKGSEIFDSQPNGLSTILETQANDPVESSLCGDWTDAKQVYYQAVVSTNEVRISLNYRCGLIDRHDVYTCLNFK